MSLANWLGAVRVGVLAEGCRYRHRQVVATPVHRRAHLTACVVCLLNTHTATFIPFPINLRNNDHDLIPPLGSTNIFKCSRSPEKCIQSFGLNISKYIVSLTVTLNSVSICSNVTLFAVTVSLLLLTATRCFS